MKLEWWTSRSASRVEWNNAKGASLKRRDHILRGKESKLVKKLMKHQKKICEKIDDAKEIKCGDIKKGGV